MSTVLRGGCLVQNTKSEGLDIRGVATFIMSYIEVRNDGRNDFTLASS